MCKNDRYVAFKIRPNVFPAEALARTTLGGSLCSPGPLVGWEGHSSPHTPLGAFGASILLTRFGWGVVPKIFLSRTDPENSKIAVNRSVGSG